MYVSRYMTRNPLTVKADVLIPEAREILRSHHFRHLPVIDDRGCLLGMVTDRDIRSAYPSSVSSEADRQKVLEEIAGTSVRVIMSADTVTLLPQSTLDDALLLLEKKRVGAFPVVNEDGVVIGVFSIRDLIRAYSGLFGLGERGSGLVAIEDDGEPDILRRIVRVLEEGDIPFTRLIRAQSPEGPAPHAAVYVRVQTYNMTAVHAALKAAGLKLAGPNVSRPGK